MINRDEYPPPRCKIGDTLDDVRVGAVRVVGFDAGGWPLCASRGQIPQLPILCGSLLDSLDRHTLREVADAWGVSIPHVVKWKKAAGKSKARGVVMTDDVVNRLGAMPDRDLAQLAGVNEYVIFLDRTRRGIAAFSEPRKPWSKEEIAMLGTATDAEIASKLKRSVASVRYKRYSLSIHRDR